jgi:L-ascorbate 6-phosphate lactonase
MSEFDVKRIDKDTWLRNTFPEWGTWLNEEIRDFPVEKGTFAMWWLGTTGLWIKSEGGANIAVDFWAGRGRSTKQEPPYEQIRDFQMTRMTGGRTLPPNLKAYPMVIDPFAVGTMHPIDALFATHIHDDHICPYVAAAVLQNSDAPFVGPQLCVDKWISWGVPEERCVVLKPGDSYTVRDTTVHAVESFDRTALITPPPEGDLRGEDADLDARMDERAVNFVIETPAGTVYDSGDSHYSDYYFKHGKQFDIDIALVSYGMNAPGTMDKVPASDCLRIAESLDARVLIPFHHDTWTNQLPDDHELAMLWDFHKEQLPFSLFLWKTGARYVWPNDRGKMWYRYPQGEPFDYFTDEPNLPYRSFI